MDKLNIYEAIAKIISENYAVGKDSRNDQQHYKYRGIDATMTAMKPLMASVGIFVVPEVLNAEREERTGRGGGTLIYSILTVRFTFYAADGTSVYAVVVGEGMDSGDKASNKAMSAAFKYALFQTFCIPTEEMIDSEKDSPDPEPKQKRGADKKPAPADEDKLTDDEQSAVDIVGRILEGVTDAETATAAIPALSAVEHPSEKSRKLARRAAASHMEALGLVYDAEAKAYKAKEEAPV